MLRDMLDRRPPCSAVLSVLLCISLASLVGVFNYTIADAYVCSALIDAESAKKYSGKRAP